MSEQKKFETILLNNIISEEQLQQIISYAQAVGIDLCEAVLQKKMAPPEAVMTAYAESLGLPFVHFADISVDEEVVVQIDPMTARQNSFIPVSIDQGHILLVTTKPVDPNIEAELRMIFNLPVHSMICLPAELSAAIAKYYPRDAVRIVKTKRNKESKPDIKKRREPLEPMSEAEKKDRLMKTFIAFNFAFAFVYFTSSSLPLLNRISSYSSVNFLLCAAAGCIAARITWNLLSR